MREVAAVQHGDLMETWALRMCLLFAAVSALVFLLYYARVPKATYHILTA